MLNSLLRARGVSCYCHGGSLLFWALAILLPFVISAKTFSIPPLPVSPYADAEISTNIAFNASRIDAKRFELNFSFECGSSNSFQVAFGRDANQDGVLSFSETDTVFGWRNGKYVIEDAKHSRRYEEIPTSPMQGTHNFGIKMRMTSDYTPKEFSARAETVQLFANLENEVPAWLYRPEWNLMRVTRRGVNTPAEWLDCRIEYRYFYMTIR